MSLARMRRQILLSYLPRLLNLVIVPLQIALLTRHLTVENYGIWNMLLSSGFIATMVFSLGLQKVLSIKVPGRSLNTQLSFFKSVLVAESLAYVGLSTIFLGLCLPWVMPLLKIDGYEGAVVAITAAFFVNLIYNEVGRLFNYQKRIEIRLLIGSFEKLLELGLLYAAISWAGVTSLNQLALIYIALYLILLLANLLFFRGFRLFFRIKLRLSIIKYALLFGAPLILSDVAWKLIQNVDYYMLSGYERKTELGLYAFISRLINYIYLAASPIIWVIYPYLVEAYHEAGNRVGEPVRNLLIAQLNYSILFLITATGALLINLDWIIELLATDAYKQELDAYFLFAPYPVLLTLMYLGQQLLLLEKRVKLISSSYFIGLAVNVGGNLVLIPALGIHGAILSTLASLTVILIIQARHFSPLRYVSSPLGLMVAIQAGVIGSLVNTSLPLLIENLVFAFQLAVTTMVLRLVDYGKFRQLVSRM